MNKIIYILAAITIFSSGYGEIRTLTISNAIDTALMNNIQIQQSERDIRIAEDQYDGSKADFWIPYISLSGNFTYIDPDSISNSVITLSNLAFFYNGRPVPYNLSAQTAYGDNYSTVFSVSKPLFTGFRLRNSMEMKKIGLELAKLKYDDVKRQISSSVSISFYNLFLIKENIKLTSDLDKNLKERMDFIKKSFKAGIASEFDSIRAEVSYKHNRPLLLKLENAYLSAEMDFCNYIGLADYTNLEFVGSLTDSTNININIPENDAISLALSNNINLKVLNHSLASLKLSKEMVSSSRYPVLSVFFNDKYSYGIEKFTDTNRSWFNSWNAGLQLSIALDSLFPSSKTACSIDEADQNIKKLLLTRQQLTDGITLQVKNLFMQIGQLKISIESQAGLMDQARLGLEIAGKRYQAGTSSLLDVTDAEVSYTQAQVAYLQAIYDYFSSEIQLKNLTGS